MPQTEYEHRLLERGHSQQRWENQVAQRYVLDDLDTEEIRRTIREAVDAGRLDSPTVGPTETLNRLRLVEGDRLLQAAIVAYAKEALPGLPAVCPANGPLSRRY